MHFYQDGVALTEVKKQRQEQNGKKENLLYMWINVCWRERLLINSISELNNLPTGWFVIWLIFDLFVLQNEQF